MCKCEKKVENGNEVEVGVLMGIIDILDEIFGNYCILERRYKNCNKMSCRRCI